MYHSTLHSALNDPAAWRRAVIRSWSPKIIRSYELLVRIGAVERPHYGYCVYHGALLGKALGHKRVSVLEFGVAGGNGLVNLEYHARNVSRLLGIDIDVYGFDTGVGLPKSNDYRDLPYHWKEGFYAMDVEKLQSRLTSASLVLGDIAETVQTFTSLHHPAPIAAICFDLDYYTSTKASFHIFDVEPEHALPRIFCYFDDILGDATALYNEYTGVRLAINEFNAASPTKKLDKAHHLLSQRVVERWYHQIYSFHNVTHPDYTTFISAENQQLHLKK